MPLSHIAGFAFEFLAHLFNSCEIYYAKPDALQGSLIDTMIWARPTNFFAVPRVWEKLEDRIKQVTASSGGVL